VIRERVVSLPSALRAARAVAAAVLVLLLSPGAARAEDEIVVPIASGMRTSQPLPPGEQIKLSLEQAIRLALQNTLDLDVVSLTYEKAAFGIGSAKGIFDPLLEVDANANRTISPDFSRISATDTKNQNGNLFVTGNAPSGGTYSFGWYNQRADSEIPGFTLYNPRYTSTISFGVTQPLLRNFGETVTTRFIVQAKYQRDSAAYAFVAGVQRGLQLIEDAYWDLAYARALLTARKEALDIAKDLNRITKIKIDVGTLAPIDIVQTEVTVAQREQDIILAEGQIGTAEDQLKRLLNVRSLPDWQRPIVTTDLPTEEPITVSVEEGMRQALQTRPEVRQALIDIDSKKLTLVYNRSQLKPRLDLAGSYGWAGLGAKATNVLPDGTLQDLGYGDALSSIFDRTYPTWQVGVVFSVPILNRTAKNNAAIASSDLELSRTNLALLKQNLWVEVRGAARDVDTALRSIAAAKKSRELAERNLDAEKKKYENGMTTSFQVSSIQNDLTNARAVELQTYAAYLKSRVAWHKAIGDLLPWKNVKIEGLPVSLEPAPAEETPAKK
jgi:outer membrane protein TolC